MIIMLVIYWCIANFLPHGDLEELVIRARIFYKVMLRVSAVTVISSEHLTEEGTIFKYSS